MSVGGVETVSWHKKLIVVRGAVEPSLAADFAAEQLERDLGRSKFFMGEAGNKNGVFTEIVSGDILPQCYPATARALEGVLPENGMFIGNINAFLNYQPPQSKQAFHMDRTVQGMAAILYGCDDWTFDYYEDDDLCLADHQREKFLTVSGAAGDLLVSAMGNRTWHRGRNDSEEPRVNAVLAS